MVTSGFMGLRADFGFVVDGLGLQAFGASRGSLVLDREGPLQDVPLMMLLVGCQTGIYSQSSSSCCGGESCMEGCMV